MGIALHSWRHPIARMIAGWPYQEATAPGSSMGQCHPVPSEPNKSHIVTTSRVSRRTVLVGAKVQSYHADTQQTSGPGLTIGLNSALGICCKAVRLSCGLAGRTARPSWRIHIRGPLRHDDRARGSGLVVPRVRHIAGYNRFSLTRASAVVKCQSVLTCFLFRLSSQAATCSARVSLSGIRRSRH